MKYTRNQTTSTVPGPYFFKKWSEEASFFKVTWAGNPTKFYSGKTKYKQQKNTHEKNMFSHESHELTGKIMKNHEFTCKTMNIYISVPESVWAKGSSNSWVCHLRLSYIFTSSCLHIFTYIFTSYIFTSHIFTYTHLHTHIFTYSPYI